MIVEFQEVSLNELQEVEGGCLGLVVAAIAIGAALLLSHD
jgi:lactobin A/cerein 7B family class IIb bacteriocin